MRRRPELDFIYEPAATPNAAVATAAGSIEPMQKPDHKAKKQGRPIARPARPSRFRGHDRRTCRTMWLDEAVSGVFSPNDAMGAEA